MNYHAGLNSINDRSPRAEVEDSFMGAFGNKPGSDRRKRRRQHKGHKYE